MRVLWLLLLMIPLGAEARGPGDSGGGSEVGIEFQAAFSRALLNIEKSSYPGFAEVRARNWSELLRQTRILAVTRELYVVQDGVRQPCVALNYPSEKRIEVNRKEWKRLGAGAEGANLEEALALHEVLSIAGLEATGIYTFSALYLANYKVTPPPEFGLHPPRGAVHPSETVAIYRQECDRYFWEGEGVGANSVTCVSNQHLGILRATYDFYLYASASRNNLEKHGVTTPFATDICKITSVPRSACTGAVIPEFGLSARQEFPFTVAIQMTATPEDRGTEVYGYAALPGSDGRCPEGLVKAHVYEAQPGSIVDPLPSNFINSNTWLNNTVVSVESPAPFRVWRTPNSESCAGDGSCQRPQGGEVLASSTSYMSLSPVLCVVPKNGVLW